MRTLYLTLGWLITVTIVTFITRDMWAQMHHDGWLIAAIIYIWVGSKPFKIKF